MKCAGCLSALAEETIVYRPRASLVSVLVERHVCLDCCQQESARLKAAGHEVIGVRDYAF